MAHTSDRTRDNVLVTSHETANRANSSVDNELPIWRGSVKAENEAVTVGDSFIRGERSHSQVRNGSPPGD